MMILNKDYLKATALFLGWIIWVVAAVALIATFVASIIALRIDGILVTLAVAAVFIYLTVAVADKLDL